jgi:1,2-diacylglycerol 3-beta-galactosyltransferase
MVKTPHLWGLGFYLSNGKNRTQLLKSILWPYVQRATRALVNKHPADLIVSVHPLAVSLILQALGKSRPPFITVVTDMVTTHALWFDPRCDRTLVPTKTARRHAITYGVPPEKVHVVGQPIRVACAQPPGDKATLRRALGWPENRFTILTVGGGEGMGPMARTTQAIAEAGLPNAALVVVTGRNARLKARLEARSWPLPTRIYGYTRQMPDFMRAADVLVTKAGPGTIAEALAASLPLILYARLPGQEDGNVRYVQAIGAGVWAPTPDEVIATLRRWVVSPAEREAAAAACRRAARPQAARTIARFLGAQIGLTSIKDALSSCPNTSGEPDLGKDGFRNLLLPNQLKN